MKLLVAEDERKVRNFISQALVQAGMVVDTVESCAELLAALTTSEYDIIVLDRLLGHEDSLTFLPGIRQSKPDVKILILSALGDVEAKVKGLTEGADDYLGKPFHVAELIARVRSLGRRKGDNTATGSDTLLIYEDVKIDLEKQKVFRSGKRIDLTRKEFQILCLLARQPGVIFSKAKILDQVWDINHYPESNIIEVTIANLRAKLDRGRKPLIQSQRNAGYWLGEP